LSNSMRATEAVPRRERILQAAESEFATAGLAGGRVERIAAKAGVNKQLVYHYFGSKAGLYDAVVRSVSDRLAIDAAPRGTPPERLRHLAELLATAGAEHASLLDSTWRARAVATAARILSEAQANGYVRDVVDPAVVSEVVVSASLGWGSLVAAHPDRHAAESRRLFTDTLVAIITDYCAWR
jgi:AcrR family transcriptional regulator